MEDNRKASERRGPYAGLEGCLGGHSRPFQGIGGAKEQCPQGKWLALGTALFPPLLVAGHGAVSCSCSLRIFLSTLLEVTDSNQPELAEISAYFIFLEQSQ